MYLLWLDSSNFTLFRLKKLALDLPNYILCLLDELKKYKFKLEANLRFIYIIICGLCSILFVKLIVYILSVETDSTYDNFFIFVISVLLISVVLMFCLDLFYIDLLQKFLNLQKEYEDKKRQFNIPKIFGFLSLRYKIDCQNDLNKRFRELKILEKNIKTLYH